ncbi:hypothetical protein ACHAXA_002863 [Cyclostephanos tholiformis]|uniref:Uncharacterized protein n=1 Tax=Cyclostephanos tholiformis TaxID=382380 RepID=A0ABD3SBG7_9STRA
MVQYKSTKQSTRRYSASTFQCLLVSMTLFVVCLYLGLAVIYISAPNDSDADYYDDANRSSVKTEAQESFELSPTPAAATKCLGNNSECCFPWSVNLDEWRTHHPDWGVTRSERDIYCLSKFNGRKATFFRNLYKLQWGVAVNDHDRTMALPKRNCSDLLQNLQISSGMGRSIKAVMNGFITAFEQGRPYQLNRLRNTSKWMYATSNTSSWGYCNTTSLNCYTLPIGNCINTYGVDDPVNNYGFSSTNNYTWFYEYLMRFNHQTLYHIQEEISKVSQIEKLGDNCTVIHVRRGDSGLPRSLARWYVGLIEYIRIANIRPEDPVLILTDDKTTIYEAKVFYPNYNWIYMDRPRVNITYGGFEGLIPSGDEVQEFVAIYVEMILASRCNKIVHGHSGFIRELMAFCETVRRVRGLPSQKYYKVVQRGMNSTERKKCIQSGRHYCAEKMIDEIYREAAEGLKNRSIHN